MEDIGGGILSKGVGRFDGIDPGIGTLGLSLPPKINELTRAVEL